MYVFREYSSGFYVLNQSIRISIKLFKMGKRHKPRSGSLAFTPRKRAKKETARIHSWVEGATNLLGFVGYKAGMTNVLAIDNRKTSPTQGAEKFIPVTIIDVPPMIALGIRAYTDGYFGLKTFTDVFMPQPSNDLKRRVKLAPNGTTDNLKKIEDELNDLADIRLLLHTQPRLTGLSKKVPDIVEVGVGGNIEDKFKFCSQILGKEISVTDVFNEKSMVDVTAVTKGKGFQGVVKRWGNTIQPRKSSKGRRHMGTGGAWTPARKLWREPLPGQMGYHTRTEYNKIILKIGKGDEITPKGGFLMYGLVKGDYVMLAGSVPGPRKRSIWLINPRRPKGDVNFEITHINLASKQGV